MAGGIIFNGNNLQTATILTQNIEHYSHPIKNISPLEVAHGNRSIIPFISHPNKVINVNGVLISNSIIALDALLDTFRGYFVGQDLNLDVENNGSTRRYICTPINVSIGRPGGLVHAPFEVQFFCTVPFGLDIANTTLVNDTAQTSVSYAPTITVAGTAPVQQPVITVTYTALSGNAGAATVSISNNATGQTISVNRTWNVNDVLVIDAFNKTVTVNGAIVTFTGAFPEFKAGSGTIGYTDGFTTRTFNFNAVYKVAYF